MNEQQSRPGPPDQEISIRRLQWFLGGRLVVATVLLGATLYFAVDVIHQGGFTPTFLLILISTIYGSSIGFGVWLLRRRGEKIVAAVMVGLDTLLITALLYLTGGAGSFFFILYGAQILTAAMTMGPVAAYVTATASLLLYLFLVTGLSFGWLALPPDQLLSQYLLTTAELSRAVLPKLVGMGSVALLASNLASRLQYAGGRIVKAEESVARLARLNDDIVRSISSGVITADENSIISTINPAAREILRDRHNLLVGQSLTEVLPTQTMKRLSEPPKREDGMGCRADGSTFPIGYTLSTLLDADGEASGLLLAFQDLTEIKNLRNKAERAERLAVLGRLATGLAHEIRNPLGAISGSVQLVHTNVSDEEDRRLLRIVVSEVDRLNELVTTMLQVGRPANARPVITDLRNLVSDVVHVARTDASVGTRIKIEAGVPEQPVLACVDADQMRQVLWNLVKNAIQASTRGGTISVRAGISLQGNPTLEISDEGKGIPEEQRKRLFDMFFSGRAHGVGLGLALVKQIVDQHGATIQVRNREPRGTLFEIQLPAVAKELEVSTPPATEQDALPDSPVA